MLIEKQMYPTKILAHIN